MTKDKIMTKITARECLPDRVNPISEQHWGINNKKARMSRFEPTISDWGCA